MVRCNAPVAGPLAAGAFACLWVRRGGTRRASVGRWYCGGSPSTEPGWLSALEASCPHSSVPATTPGARRSRPRGWARLPPTGSEINARLAVPASSAARCSHWRVTVTAALAFFCASMVRCSWSTTGRASLFLLTRAGHRPAGRASQQEHGPGYDPGEGRPRGRSALRGRCSARGCRDAPGWRGPSGPATPRPAA